MFPKYYFVTILGTGLKRMKTSIMLQTFVVYRFHNMFLLAIIYILIIFEVVSTPIRLLLLIINFVCREATKGNDSGRRGQITMIKHYG